MRESGKLRRSSTALGHIPGVLLAYHRPIAPRFRDASTVLEHVRSFRRYSRFRVWEVNTDEGFPPGLEQIDLDAIILHYSLFGMGGYRLDKRWRQYLKETSAYTVAFFQDECTRCGRRFRFLNEHDIDCVYTLLQPSEFGKVYGRYTAVRELVSNLPGYVSEELLDAARRFTLADGERTIDVGYRGRPLPAYLGRGAQEKHLIGERFAEFAAGAALRLDLAGREADRLYGDDWYRFLANCRCVLGVESGVSAFDLEDEVYREFLVLSEEQGEVTIDDLSSLERWEDVVYYRTISPRHFEAAALRVCQVLFEGRYSQILEPMVHYIPLRRDFSNIDEVLELVKDARVREELTENAYRDLIASGRCSYERLVADVDRTLQEAGAEPQSNLAAPAAVDAALRRRRRWRRLRRQAEWAAFVAVRRPPLQSLIRAAHPLTARVRAATGRPAPAEEL